jgi:hypothetical protein
MNARHRSDEVPRALSHEGPYVRRIVTEGDRKSQRRLISTNAVGSNLKLTGNSALQEGRWRKSSDGECFLKIIMRLLQILRHRLVEIHYYYYPSNPHSSTYS